MSIQTKEQANSRLRYAIRVIQGKEFAVKESTRIAFAIWVKDELEAYGWPWQAWILDTWIHRLQGGQFTARRADPKGDWGETS